MAAITAGNSYLLLGALGNVLVNFDSADLGKTTEDTALTKIEDVKDILYSQDGTQPDDHISTGMIMQLSATFGEIKTGLLQKLLYSFSSEVSDFSAEDDSGTFGRYIYQSLRDNKAKKLIITATDENGVARTGAQNILNFYEALPIIDENLINWGADTQRNLPTRFMIYYSKFGASQVSGGPVGAFGYYGSATVEKVPAIASYPA
jgi:hypothetical protein